MIPVLSFKGTLKRSAHHFASPFSQVHIVPAFSNNVISEFAIAGSSSKVKLPPASRARKYLPYT